MEIKVPTIHLRTKYQICIEYHSLQILKRSKSFWSDGMRVITLIKKGNFSAAIAALGNLIIAIIKIIVAFISGNGTMFATAMHSIADTVNQSFVYIGSILSEMSPRSEERRVGKECRSCASTDHKNKKTSNRYIQAE